MDFMKDELTEKAKNIIHKILYITIATSNKKGEPWNSPVYSAFDENYNFYWVSWKDSQHSKNIKENNQIFIVIYDSRVPEGTGEGVYIKAKAYELSDVKEMSHALSCLDGRVNKKPHSPEQFVSNMPRRIYKAIPEKVWMNVDGDVNGEYVDKRVEVDL